MRIKIIKSILLISALFSMNTFAVGPGFYMGLMLGPATNDGNTVQAQIMQPGAPLLPPPALTVSATPKSQQFGTRVFIGNQINSYVAFELGLDYFTGISYDAKNIPPGFDTCSSLQARVRGFDGVVKGIFPFGNSFDVYVKAGPALIYETTSGALNGATMTSTGLITCGKSTHTTKVRLTGSIGASYAWNQNWVTDISWNRYMVGGIVNNVDYYAIGLSYHFVDKYCGQFLCD